MLREPIAAARHVVAPFVGGPLDAPPLLLVAAPRNRVPDPLPAAVAADLLTTIPFVSTAAPWFAARPPASGAFDCALLQQRRERRRFAARLGGQEEGDRLAPPRVHGVGCGSPLASVLKQGRAAPGLFLAPLFCPSRVLVGADHGALAIRTADAYDVRAAAPTVDMAQVRDYLRRASAAVYQFETPETLQRAGVEVVLAPARCTGPHTIRAGARPLTAKAFLICTGAAPQIPDVSGLDAVPYRTYQQLFEGDRLPARLIILGSGPIGVEIAQAYQRLGSQVRLVGKQLLPRDEPDASMVLGRAAGRRRYGNGLARPHLPGHRTVTGRGVLSEFLG